MKSTRKEIENMIIECKYKLKQNKELWLNEKKTYQTYARTKEEIENRIEYLESVIR